MVESESGGENISVAELAELAALDSYGLLDEHEAARFAAAFSNAPERVQQEIRAIQSRLANESQLLPDVEPEKNLAQRVREQVALAMQRERSGNEETPAIPSQTEIASLPRRAQVAFAARSALRVQPLFKHSWPDAPQSLVDAIDRAITVAQISAVSPVDFFASEEREADVAAHAARAHIAYTTALDAARSVGIDAAYGAANAAANAANAAARSYSANANADADADADANVAYSAAVNAVNAVNAAHATYATRAAVIAAMRRDYELLKAAAEHEKWTDDTPVPPEFFGPLWPDGEPEDWPKEDVDQEIDPHALKIQFTVPRGMTKRESREFNEKIQAFFIALSAFDASMGGTGLQILDDESEDPIEIEDAQPVHTDADCAGVGA